MKLPLIWILVLFSDTALFCFVGLLLDVDRSLGNVSSDNGFLYLLYFLSGVFFIRLIHEFPVILILSIAFFMRFKKTSLFYIFLIRFLALFIGITVFLYVTLSVGYGEVSVKGAASLFTSLVLSTAIAWPLFKKVQISP